jgi:hypothetical protein
MALAVLASLVGPGAWGLAAASGAVHFNPESPAGKEYALPLEQAREEAAGTQGQPGSKSGGAALFGVGVSGGRNSGGTGSGGGRAGGVAAHGSSGTPVEAAPGPGQEGAKRARSNGHSAPTNIALAKTGGGFSLTVGVAIVAGILLAAAVAGWVMRRLPPSAGP